MKEGIKTIILLVFFIFLGLQGGITQSNANAWECSNLVEQNKEKGSTTLYNSIVKNVIVGKQSKTALSITAICRLLDVKITPKTDLFQEVKLPKTSYLWEYMVLSGREEDNSIEVPRHHPCKLLYGGHSYT